MERTKLLYDRPSEVLAVALTLTIIASIVVTVRVYIRIWVKRTFGWDDGLIVISLVRVA